MAARSPYEWCTASYSALTLECDTESPALTVKQKRWVTALRRHSHAAQDMLSTMQAPWVDESPQELLDCLQEAVLALKTEPGSVDEALNVIVKRLETAQLHINTALKAARHHVLAARAASKLDGLLISRLLTQKRGRGRPASQTSFQCAVCFAAGSQGHWNARRGYDVHTGTGVHQRSWAKLLRVCSNESYLRSQADLAVKSQLQALQKWKVECRRCPDTPFPQAAPALCLEPS